ncbi:unnamed protein product, partial [Larinioides sclopetarius]
MLSSESSNIPSCFSSKQKMLCFQEIFESHLKKICHTIIIAFNHLIFKNNCQDNFVIIEEVNHTEIR